MQGHQVVLDCTLITRSHASTHSLETWTISVMDATWQEVMHDHVWNKCLIKTLDLLFCKLL